MSTPRVYKTEAIILRHVKLGESDRILTLYTPLLGKIKVVAKGSRRPGSKLGGHVELMTHSLVMLSKGRTFDILTQGQTINSFLPLRNDLWLTSCGLYAIDLVDRFTYERLESQPVFDLLRDTLEGLCEPGDRELLLRYFEIGLLHHLGYRPQVHECVGCGTALQQGTNYFSSAQGGVLCPKCGSSEALLRPVSVNALKVLRLWQSGDYTTARRLKVSSSLAFELEQLLKEYIVYLLDFEMNSARWLSRLKNERRYNVTVPATPAAEDSPPSQ